MLEKLTAEAIFLLQELIRLPSYSREEQQSGDLLEKFFLEKDFHPQRKGNNIWVQLPDFQIDKPTVLLNSHHDTVKASPSWTLDPFKPLIKEGKLYGLGSNDAGASLVGLAAVFLYFSRQKTLPFNLIYCASAEEEVSGKGGIESIITDLGKIDLGIIGEPTLMQMAVAEKGLLVLDCASKGVSGHAAREEGLNAIYEAMPDIQWFSTYQFPKKSDLLGPVKMTVTQIQAGTQHNVVPDTCTFVVDVRTNEHYSNAEILQLIENQVKCSVKARSLRLNSSQIPLTHPIVKRGLELGLTYYGSPTLSDQALLSFPTIKIGIGDSARSHTADEFVFIREIEEGIKIYVELLEGLNVN
jgi:acetylornithine deacetylase